MAFYIIKKDSGNFWHRFNADAKEVNLSEWQIVLELVGQTVSLQMRNGSNVPANPVSILDVIVIDETDASAEETFTDVEVLRTRLVALGYNPYVSADGGATYIEAGTNVTITGTGTLVDPYVINSSGGGGGGGSVATVTGTLVTGTSSDPVVDTPDINAVIDVNGGQVEDRDVTFSSTTEDDVTVIDHTGITSTNFEGDTSRLTGAGLETTNGWSYLKNGILEKGSGGDDVFIDAEVPTGNGNIRFPDVVDAQAKITVSISVTADTTAVNNARYTANGTIVFTDPTPVTNQGYIVHVIGGTSEIDSVIYNVGALVYRFYDGSAWVTSLFGNASVVDIGRSELLDLITAETINPKAQYRIYNAVGDTAVVRVWGVSNTRIDTVAFKEGYWNGATYVLGAHGYYNIDTDVFTQLLVAEEAVSFTESAMAVTDIEVFLINVQPDLDYQVIITPTSLLAIGGYVSDKATDSFILTFPSPITGDVTFDYVIFRI